MKESEGINTSDANDKIIVSILSALAELESQQKSIAIKEDIRYRMQEGLYKFSVRNTIGYCRDYAGRVKSGVLRGFLFMDLSWNSDDLSKFLELMESASDDKEGTERN